MTLRGKVVLTVTLAVVAAVLATGVVVERVVVASGTADAREAVGGRVTTAAAVLATTGVVSMGVEVDDDSVPPVLLDSLELGVTRTYVQPGGRRPEVVWAARPVVVEGRTVVVSLRSGLTALDAQRAVVVRALVGGGLVSTVLVGLVASAVVGRMSQRLTLGAAAAERVADGAQETPIVESVGDARDEVGAFARAVDRMAVELRHRVEVERRFTADLAHELRTPVAGLVASAGLLEDSPETRLVRRGVDRLRELVEDLLEISRVESGAASLALSSVDVGALVEGILLTVAGGKTVDLVVLRAPVVVVTDRRRLERVVVNLVSNALRHGAPPVRVQVDEDGIEVRDAGPGLPPTVVERGPTRFVSDGGTGLGLVVCLGQASVLGLQVDLDAEPSVPGACVQVRWQETGAGTKLRAPGGGGAPHRSSPAAVEQGAVGLPSVDA